MCFSAKEKSGGRSSRQSETLHAPRPAEPPTLTSAAEKASAPERKPTGRRTAGATARLNKTKFRQSADVGRGSTFEGGRGDGTGLQGGGGGAANDQSGGLYGGVNGGVHGGVYGGANGGVTGGSYGGVYGTQSGGGYVGQGMGGGGHSSTGGF